MRRPWPLSSMISAAKMKPGDGSSLTEASSGHNDGDEDPCAVIARRRGQRGLRCLLVHAGSSCWPKNCRIWLARPGGRCRTADHRKFKIFAFAAHAPISSTRPFNLVKLSVRLEVVAFIQFSFDGRRKFGKNTKSVAISYSSYCCGCDLIIFGHGAPVFFSPCQWDARDRNILRGAPPIDDVDSISTLKRSPPLGAGCKELVLTAAEMQVSGCTPCATLLSPSYRSFAIPWIDCVPPSRNFGQSSLCRGFDG